MLHSPEPPRCWSIASNIALTSARSASLHSGRPPPDGSIHAHGGASPTPAAHYAAEQRRTLVAQAVARLPEKYRIVIILRDIEERPYVEIAEILSLPVTTLKMRAIRGREMLAKLVERMTDP